MKKSLLKTNKIFQKFPISLKRTFNAKEATIVCDKLYLVGTFYSQIKFCKQNKVN